MPASKKTNYKSRLPNPKPSQATVPDIYSLETGSILSLQIGLLINFRKILHDCFGPA